MIKIVLLMTMAVMVSCASHDPIDVMVTRSTDQWSIVVQRNGHTVATSNGPVGGPNTTSLVSVVDRTRIAVHIPPTNTITPFEQPVARTIRGW